MGNPIPGWLVGGFLTILGAAMLRAQQKTRKSISNQEYAPQDQLYLRNRIRRRSQVAGLILLIGIMIPVGDSLIPWQRAVATFAIYWIIVLILALWTIVLAFADIAATQLHSTVELHQISREQQRLEQIARHLREQQSSPRDSQN